MTATSNHARRLGLPLADLPLAGLRLVARRLVALPLTVVAAVLGVTLGPAAAAGAATPWLWPVEPARVVHDFDPPDDPWGSGHRGVDLAASVGQPVTAPAAGTVTFAGVIAGRGVVVVSHGAVRTTYEPVTSAVEVGAAVEPGAHLGALQGFAHHCESPCLHWGAIRGGVYIDPTSFIVVPPSRLLPVWDDDASGRSAGGAQAPNDAAARAGAAVGARARPPPAPVVPWAPGPDAGPAAVGGAPGTGATAAATAAAAAGGVLILAAAALLGARRRW